MHAYFCLLPILLVAFGDEGGALKEVGVTLPASIANIKFKSKQQFDQKALGYGVAYANKMCLITLYVYDFGLKEIPNGKSSQPVEDQLKRATEDLRSAEKSGIVQKLVEMKDDVPLPREATSMFASAGFTFEIAGGTCKTYVLVAARNNHFLKVRVTQYVVDEKTNDAEVEEFLGTLVKELSK